MNRQRKAEPFCIQDYRLVPGTEIYRKTLLNAKVLMDTDTDRLLYTFRENAGLDTRQAVPLGGWESPHLHFRGHYMGHFLTACARSSLILKSTDPEIAAALGKKAGVIVQGLAECQQALGKKESHPGYLAAIESSMLDDLEALHFTGIYTVVYYNLHKIMAGLLDTWLLLQDKPALSVLENMAGYIEWRLERLTPERMEAMTETRWYRENSDTFHMEFGGMHEVLLRLYEATKEKRYLDLAQKFDRGWFRDMLSGKKDLLGHYALHANTEIPCVIGLAEYADICGDEASRECVTHFMEWLKVGHMLPTGGVSGRPAYPSPADYGGELFEFPHMYYKHTNFKNGESCCSHNLNILSRKEFSWTADCRWAQEHERRYVNAVLAQQHPETGGFVYNLCMTQGSHKNHSADGFFCCNGTGVESHAYLTEGSFFHKGDTLWLTNYVPCDLYWGEQETTVEARTGFPMDGKLDWTLRLKEKKKLTLNVRIPEWAGADARLLVNGTEVQIRPGSFAALERIWEDGDTIHAEFPFHLSAGRMEDRPEYVAVFYGPHLLIACAQGFAQFEGMQRELMDSLVPGEKPCEFITQLTCGTTVFRPICNVVEEEYNGYTIVTEPAEFIVADQVLLGEEASEKAHSLESQCGRTGENTQGTFLLAQYPGSISCCFRTVPGKKLWLRCFYADKGVLRRIPGQEAAFNRCFRLEVSDGEGTEEIAVQSLYEEEGVPLTEVYYPVMERQGEICLKVSGCPYEGESRGTAGFYNKIEIGYFK